MRGRKQSIGIARQLMAGQTLLLKLIGTVFEPRDPCHCFGNDRCLP